MFHQAALAVLYVLSWPASDCRLEMGPSPHPVWETRRDLYAQGLREADAFRKHVLATDDDLKRVELIGGALEEFRNQASRELTGPPHLERFSISRRDFLDQIRDGSVLDGTKVFGPFERCWSQRWDRIEVDHHWHAVKRFDPPEQVAPELPKVMAAQYAWIGDGFRWNYLVADDERPGGTYILGMVYHLDSSSPETIRLKRPYVGYSAGDRRLIWVAGDVMFFEESLAATHDSAERYAITGFYYEIRDGELRSRDLAFEGAYSLRADERPVFRRFSAAIRVSESMVARRQ